MTAEPTIQAGASAPAVMVLDNRRTPCAIGLIRANDESAKLPIGTTMQILTRDRFAPIEISLWARRNGHSVPVETKAGTWPARYRVFSLVLGGAAGVENGVDVAATPSASS